MQKIMVNGQVWVELYGQLHIGAGRSRLLEKIHELGSISGAARALNLSYKRAWSMVKEMNTHAGRLLVEKSSGGLHGGGARLTKEGMKVVSRFNRLSEDFEHFKNLYNRRKR